MPFLNLDLDYFDHPKTKRLVGLLGRGAAELPIRIWCYCGKYHAESGSLASYSAQEIESIAGWWGKVGDMISAMEKVELIEKDAKGWKVKDWVEINGHLAAFKTRAKKAARKRWGMLKHATSIAQARPKQSSYLTIPTIPNLPNLTREKTSRPDWFTQVWSRYPRKKGKEKAKEAFYASVRTEEELKTIYRALENYLKSNRVKGGFIQDGSRWFKAKEWQDWVDYIEPEVTHGEIVGSQGGSKYTRVGPPAVLLERLRDGDGEAEALGRGEEGQTGKTTAKV